MESSALSGSNVKAVEPTRLNRFFIVVAPSPFGSDLNFFNEFRFQLHGTEAIDFTIDIVVSVDQPNIFDFRAYLYDG